METYCGKSVSSGIAVGKVLFLNKNREFYFEKIAEDEVLELERLRKGIEAVEGNMAELAKGLDRGGFEQERVLMDSHKLLLTDPIFLKSCEDKIRKEKASAERAVYETGTELARSFEDLSDDFMRSRGTDIRDVMQQLLRALAGDKRECPELTEPVILVAEELTPSQTLGIDKDKILAFVVQKGSVNSHVSILARLWNIPAVIGAMPTVAWDGQQGVVDGENGVFYLNPTQDLITKIKGQQQTLGNKEEELKAYLGLTNETKSGQTIELYANVGSLSDVETAIENDAGGIGLFRTEFLFLGCKEPPTEEEQFEIYRDAVINMKGKPVIIRTMDIGADKQVEYLEVKGEANPALGLRGVRLSLAKPALFKAQLRAIFRAAVFGDVRVMYPMVTSLNEIHRVKQLVKQVKEELRLQNYRYADVKQGIMIETPAAAVLSDVLANEVDFFSIGTNDLTQYTLAADRQNSALVAYYDGEQEAVLRMIKQTVENGHLAGIPVGLCGELAGNTELTAQFLEWGVDELSLAPSKILEVRKVVRACD